MDQTEYSKIMARLDTIEDLLFFIFSNQLGPKEVKKFFDGGTPQMVVTE